MKPIAITVPRYGKEIRGGAEQAARYLAHILKDAGADVEILTTCVQDATCDRGKNNLPEGIEDDDGIVVRRFPVKPQILSKLIEANLQIYSGKAVSLKEEWDYFEEDINSPAMCSFIRENKDNYYAFLFIPYLYGVTFNGVMSCPEKAILIPCFHDEGYAYMELVRMMSESVKGIIFLSHPEEILANRLFNISKIPNKVLGIGIDDGWEDDADPEAFRNKFDIRSNFVMYAGRKDSGKKVDELIDYFCKYIEKNKIDDLKLVLIGGGSVSVPKNHENDIRDLGYVDLEDKRNAYAACTLFVNPSRFESFSIVIMEAWLARKPVMVSFWCDVTKRFCIESNGGLYYNGFDEFEKAMHVILDNKDIAEGLGNNGYEFVKKNYSNKVIADKYIGFIKQCIENE